MGELYKPDSAEFPPPVPPPIERPAMPKEAKPAFDEAKFKVETERAQEQQRLGEERARQHLAEMQAARESTDVAGYLEKERSRNDALAELYEMYAMLGHIEPVGNFFQKLTVGDVVDLADSILATRHMHTQAVEMGPGIINLHTEYERLLVGAADWYTKQRAANQDVRVLLVVEQMADRRAAKAAASISEPKPSGLAAKLVNRVKAYFPSSGKK